ncbi:MAG: ComEC family competence protein [Bacteroidetes bacterium]|nr:ComEC family competence protein [Bacteroidota bacterium]
MALYTAHFWKKAPFVKLLLAFAAGIILQLHLQPVLYIWLILLLTGLVCLTGFLFLPFFSRFKFAFFTGLAIAIIFAAAGGILAWNKDVRKDKDWLGHTYKNGEAIIAVLDEPPVEKTKSFKADANVQYVIRDGLQIPVRCRLILYFRKDSASQTDSLPLQLSYGSKIIFKNPLQEIKNSGNPGGFDYKRYSLFRGITYQVFLKRDEYEIIPGRTVNPAKQVIYSTRQKVLNILRKNIPGPKELGLAEALLIGYKDDLDQSLVQSYTNTGVVHIIAISGLHLGLIYWLLALLLKPLTRNKKTKWLRPLLIITGLWGFSLLAGAQPSVLRSAFMFSFIVLGETFSRKTSIYNTMAVSAFLLLCINPYGLWDVGFQLSYAAVLSIIIFMRPIYNWFYIKNKALDFIWKLNAVTLAAQILTIPLSIYHFHQFPLLFFLTNFLAVPLSSIILLGEILLCCISFIPAAAMLLGKALFWLIWVMNTYVEQVELIPGSLWDGLQISISQVVLLIVFTAGISYWLMEKQKQGLYWGLASLFLFTIFRTASFIKSNQQQKIIVYNVPQKTAIDFISGRKFQFVGDSDVLFEGFARNFHLKPSRILLRLSRVYNVQGFQQEGKFIAYKGKHIMLAGESISFDTSFTKQTIDLLIISKNPRLYFKNLVTALDIKQVVFDGSAPAWKVNYWKKDCDSLKIPWHDVSMKGAFVMKIN